MSKKYFTVCYVVDFQQLFGIRSRKNLSRKYPLMAVDLVLLIKTWILPERGVSLPQICFIVRWLLDHCKCFPHFIKSFLFVSVKCFSSSHLCWHIKQKFLLCCVIKSANVSNLSMGSQFALFDETLHLIWHVICFHSDGMMSVADVPYQRLNCFEFLCSYCPRFLLANDLTLWGFNNFKL